MSRFVEVTTELYRAWEVWNVEIPDDVEDEMVEEYVRENFNQGTTYEVLADTGWDSFEIVDVGQVYTI